MEPYDVVVVGAGNAAMCAALSAQECGARVAVLERSPESVRGGNSTFTGGAFRVAYKGVEDLRSVVPDLSREEVENTDFGSYDADTYYDDLARMSHYRIDPGLAETLVNESLPTMQWMVNELGVRFVPIYGRQAFKVDGRFKFWGGLTVEVSGGGVGLIETLHEKAAARGVEVFYQTRAIKLLKHAEGLAGVRCIQAGQERDILARNVILAAGGFHAHAAWRARYLGPNWDLARVRGSRYNTGDGIQMAERFGALVHGHWSGCHSVAYDANAPAFGDIDLLNQQKNSFWLGVMVNAKGERFVDEGANFRNYIYAQMGRWILAQPGAIAWQIFDNKVADLLTDEYRIRHATKYSANTLEGLVEQIADVDQAALLNTLNAYNDAVDRTTPFNPTVKDGKSAGAITPPKSNWANALDTPPYTAFAVTCGITMTYGGVSIDSQAAVQSAEGGAIEGLYAAGEMVGGFYYHDYPGGAGLMAGSVFGRIAGINAASGAK
ncbi:MAG: FAD-dependent tricarballylate dehydrogenase TcuA [Pseudomonadota bacterium]